MWWLQSLPVRWLYIISGSYLPSKCGLWVASICVASMWLVRLRRLAGLPVHWRPCLASRWPPSMALTRLLILWLPCVFFLSGSWATTLIYACSATSMFGVPDASFMWVHLIFVDIYRYLCLCASFLVRIAGGGAAPSPCTPHPLFFLTGSPCYLLFFCFLMSIIVYLGLCVFEHALVWQEKKTPLRCHGKEVIGGAGD